MEWRDKKRIKIKKKIINLIKIIEKVNLIDVTQIKLVMQSSKLLKCLQLIDEYKLKLKHNLIGNNH